MCWTPPAENGAATGDSASTMIHAAQNLESAVGGVKRLAWFRARGIVEYLARWLPRRPPRRVLKMEDLLRKQLEGRAGLS